MIEPHTPNELRVETIQLPKFLCPLYETDLIRIGKDNDGGYLIPKQSLSQTKLLYSFGLNDDWSFEEEFYNKTGAKIICYDHTVNWKLFLKVFLRDFKSLFKYFKYRIFFYGKNKIHEKKIISPVGTFYTFLKEDKIVDLNSILIDYSSNSFFFKIDIEGFEYRILEQLIKYASCMTGLVIEFHDCDLNHLRIKNFIENFDLQLVHIHVNNWGFVTPNRFPQSLELTFSPKQFNKKITNESKKFPISLDQPNNPLFQDQPIEFKD